MSTVTTQNPAHSNGQGRLPGPGSNGAMTAAAPSSGITGEEVFRLLRWNLWLILAFTLAGLGAGIPAHHLLARHFPRYTAKGLLRIERSQLLNPITERTADLADTQLQAELRTQAKLLTADRLFSDVLRRGGALAETRWLREQSRTEPGTGRVIVDAAAAKELMARSFAASPLQDSTLLSVSFTAKEPADARRVLMEIVSEHLRQQRDRAEDARTAQTRTLRDLSRTLSNRITELSARTRDKQGTLLQEGLAAAGLFGTREIELRALVEARLRTASDAAAAEQTHRYVEERLQKGEPINEIESVVQNDPAIASLSRELVGHEVQLEIARGNLGARHGDVLKLERLVELTRSSLERRRGELRKVYGQYYGQSLQLSATRLADANRQVQTRLDEMKGRLAELSRELPQLALDQQEEKELRSLRQQVDDRLRDIDLAQNLADPLRIQWASEPEVPDQRSFPQLKAVLPVSAVVGAAIALALVFLRELLDQSVRSPADLRRSGQPELLGLVCDRADDPQARATPLAVIDAPRSQAADQFRALRTRLGQRGAQEPLRSILVTSPAPGGGTTAVAANLAAALAESGREVLLVDANFRRPALATLFGLPVYARIADVVSGRCELADAVRPTRLPRLSLLASSGEADAPDLAGRLAGADALALVLKALERFDHVIFDAPPVLLASEAAALAAAVDGVVTVVRAHHQSRGKLRRLCELLRQIKARHLGVVLNAVRARRGGYYRDGIRLFYEYHSRAAKV